MLSSDPVDRFPDPGAKTNPDAIRDKIKPLARSSDIGLDQFYRSGENQSANHEPSKPLPREKRAGQDQGSKSNQVIDLVDM
ncbi:hypothetical protein R1W01_17125 [Shimia sp. FJ5]|nr:hypothetical protein [Shimia sp. FJ5]MDV4146550.1 hypothetical protein [Shimia sp. FJ5]